MKARICRFLVAFIFVQFTLMSCSVFKAGAASRPHGTISSMADLRLHVAGWAENYLGTKYKYASTDPKRGFDCSGFTSYVMQEFDIKLSPGSSTQATQGNKISLDEVQTGDLIFFGKGNDIQHVALVSEVTDKGIICIHATNTRGVVKENIYESDYWKKRILYARDVITPLAKI
jgi:cell wall-associated NlpC family hydrolase